MDYNTHRRRAGVFIGVFLGIGYSLTANLINHWALRDIPIYAPPPGEFWIIVITILMFGGLGLVAAWTEESLPGVLISGLAGSFLSSVWMLINETANRGGAFALLALIFLPRMFFYMPFGALVRWLIHKWDQPTAQVVAPVRRLIPAILSFVILASLGTFSLFPEETRVSLVRMDALLKEGMQSQATTRNELPKPLQSVDGFIQNAKGEYRFTIGSDPDVLPVQRPVVEYGEPEPFIIIRFENGFRFGCVFSPPYIQPACGNF